MLKKIALSTCLILLFCFTETSAQQDGSQSLSESIPKTKYETFLASPGKIFLTQYYPIGELGKQSLYDVSVLVAWESGGK